MSEATKFTLFKRSNGVWYILFVQDGRKRWKSTKARVKTDALKALTRFKELFKAKIAYTPISSFMVDYLSYSTSVHKPGTTEGHKYALQELSKILGDISIHQVGVREVEKVLAVKIEKVSKWRARGVYNSLRSAFETAKRWKMISENPFTQVTRPRPPEVAPPFLSIGDFATLIKVIDNKDFRDLVLTALLTGLRLSELASLEWTDIDFDRKVIFIRNKSNFTTKNNRNRRVPMSDSLFTILKERLTFARSETSWVFYRDGAKLSKDYISKKFKDYVKLTTLDQRLHFHSLRHTFASWLVQDGASLYEVQRLLGHSSAAVTQIYSHLQPETLHTTVNRIHLNLN